MIVEGVTIEELIKATGLKRSAIEVRIHRLGIEALTNQAIYPPDTLQKILAVKGPGRPKKPAIPPSEAPD